MNSSMSLSMTRVSTVRAALLLSVPALTFAACVPSSGPALHRGGPPADPIATYTVPFCVAADGTRIPGTSFTYYLTRNKNRLALLELDQSGQGRSFGDSFLDENGHNFIYQTQRKGEPQDAVHFVVPESPTENAARYHFPPGTFTPSKGKVRKIDGDPTYTCELVNQARPASAPPVGVPGGTQVPNATPAAPPGQPPNADAVCVPGQTQQCVGPAACRGGQVCLPGGTGFGPCDCGEGVSPPSSALPPAPPAPPPQHS